MIKVTGRICKNPSHVAVGPAISISRHAIKSIAVRGTLKSLRVSWRRRLSVGTAGRGISKSGGIPRSLSASPRRRLSVRMVGRGVSTGGGILRSLSAVSSW